MFHLFECYGSENKRLLVLAFQLLKIEVENMLLLENVVARVLTTGKKSYQLKHQINDLRIIELLNVITYDINQLADDLGRSYFLHNVVVEEDETLVDKDN